MESGLRGAGLAGGHVASAFNRRRGSRAASEAELMRTRAPRRESRAEESRDGGERFASRVGHASGASRGGGAEGVGDEFGPGRRVESAAWRAGGCEKSVSIFNALLCFGRQQSCGSATGGNEILNVALSITIQVFDAIVKS